MDPSCGSDDTASRGLPRTRGDGPASPTCPMLSHRRPARCCRPRLPRTRGDGPSATQAARRCIPASPHTRGWTRLFYDPLGRKGGFPAHAGMDPSCGSDDTASRGLPRTRGDGPASPTCPMLSHRRPARCCRPRLPRTRGDGPSATQAARRCIPASPHTRGWTRLFYDPLGRKGGFPAHAGMDLVTPDRPHQQSRLPRTRGDGSSISRYCEMSRLASPHTRGWTPHRAGHEIDGSGFPAHAGMDPTVSPDSSRSGGLPRTRGDGPKDESHISLGEGASPHTRGWTPECRTGHVSDRAGRTRRGRGAGRRAARRARCSDAGVVER